MAGPTDKRDPTDLEMQLQGPFLSMEVLGDSRSLPVTCLRVVAQTVASSLPVPDQPVCHGGRGGVASGDDRSLAIQHLTAHFCPPSSPKSEI